MAQTIDRVRAGHPGHGLASDFIQQTPSDQPFFVDVRADHALTCRPTTRATDDMACAARRGAAAFNADTHDASARRGATRGERRSRLDEIADLRRATTRGHGARGPQATRRRGRALAGRLARRPLAGHARHLPVGQRLPVRRAPPVRGRTTRGRSRSTQADGGAVPGGASRPTKAFASNALVQNVDLAATIADLGRHLPWGRRRAVVPAGPGAQAIDRADGRPDRSRAGERLGGAVEPVFRLCRTRAVSVQTPGFEGIVTARYK